MMEAIVGTNILNKQGQRISVSSLEGDDKIIGIYFSAHWCPPCRRFTPALAEWYKGAKAKSDGSRLEIIFISCDRSKDAFDEYFAEMPWLCLDFSDKAKNRELSRKFSVDGIPHLVFVNGQGQIISEDGYQMVQRQVELSDIK